MNKPPASHLAAQKRGKGPHIGRYGHGIIIQNHDKIFLCVACLVEPFKGQTGSHGAIANHGNDPAFFSFKGLCRGNTQPSRYGGTAVSRIKSVVRAFFPLGKTADTAVGPQRVKAIPSARNQFVGIGLVAHIPYDLVFRGIKYVVQGDGQLHNAQTGRQMAPRLRHGLHNFLPDFSSERFQFLQVQFFEICGAVDGLKKFSLFFAFFHVLLAIMYLAICLRGSAL